MPIAKGPPGFGAGLAKANGPAGTAVGCWLELAAKLNAGGAETAAPAIAPPKIPPAGATAGAAGAALPPNENGFTVAILELLLFVGALLALLAELNENALLVLPKAGGGALFCCCC